MITKIHILFFLVCTFFGSSQESLIRNIPYPGSGDSVQVEIHFPHSYSYASDKVEWPIYVLLDGQHNWFIEPTMSFLQHLAGRYQIPEGLIVTIPLHNRSQQCQLPSPLTDTSALHQFTMRVISEVHQQYSRGPVFLFGHSYTASFALYSFLLSPNTYSGLIAFTPMDQLEELCDSLVLMPEEQIAKVGISYGGSESTDSYHYGIWEKVKAQHPDITDKIQFLEAPFTGHNAVPIVTGPYLITQLLREYSIRTNTIAQVNDMYELVGEPETPVMIQQRLAEISNWQGRPLSLQIPEINGVASRYHFNREIVQADQVYQLGLQLYPKYYGFYDLLSDLHRSTSPKRSYLYLLEAICKAKKEKVAPEILHDLKQQRREREEEILPMVHIQTDYGSMRFTFLSEAPNHTLHFIRLAETLYWDSLTFNRIIPDFVVQGGCPDTEEGFSTSPHLIDAEISPAGKHIFGALGAGRDQNPEKQSAYCQFYIVHSEKGVPRLDGDYTIFGSIWSGSDVLRTLGHVPTDDRDQPKDDIPIELTIEFYQKNKEESWSNILPPRD